MKIIERAWLSYLKSVVPKDAGEAQIKETRRAFYSGAAILFTCLTGTAFDNDIEPTTSDLDLMADIQEEVDTFGAELDLAVLGIRRH